MVLELCPPHISLYGLSIEPNTPFDRAAQSGSLTTPPSEVWRRMYDRIVEALETAGWERYEVSNFARPGHRAIHNEAVWRGGHYAGLGPGAHGFRPSGDRTVGPPNLQQWLEDPTPDVTRPSRHEHAMDRILSTLRHSQGLDLNALRTESGLTIEDQTLRALTATGAVRLVDAHLQLTPDAYPIADGIVRRLIDGLASMDESSVST
jgi:oxygen-independent coproporphyrinogen-3 oxidase